MLQGRAVRVDELACQAPHRLLSRAVATVLERQRQCWAWISKQTANCSQRCRVAGRDMDAETGHKGRQALRWDGGLRGACSALSVRASILSSNTVVAGMWSAELSTSPEILCGLLSLKAPLA